MSERPLPADRFIDDVARSMTSTSAPDLRARVLAQLPDRRHGFRTWLVPAVAIACVVTVAVAIVTQRAVQPAPVGTEAHRAPAVGDTTGVGAYPVSAARLQAAVQLRKAQPNEAALEWQARAVAPMPAIDGLTVAPIQPTALAIPQLNVKPIEDASPLAVAPLDSVNHNR